MASYATPIYQKLFNPNNFTKIYELSNFVYTTSANVFTSINTFMNDVFINGTLYVNDIQIVNNFMGYSVSYFYNLRAPIQQQFDAILSNDNVIINSTVSVGNTTTVNYDERANVTNSGTYTNAILNF